MNKQPVVSSQSIVFFDLQGSSHFSLHVGPTIPRRLRRDVTGGLECTHNESTMYEKRYMQFVIIPEPRDHRKPSAMVSKPRRRIVGTTIAGNFFPNLLMLQRWRSEGPFVIRAVATRMQPWRRSEKRKRMPTGSSRLVDVKSTRRISTVSRHGVFGFAPADPF